MLSGTPAAFRRAQVRVIQDDWNIGKAFGETANMIRVGIAGSAVTGHGALRLSRNFEERIESAVISRVIVHRRMEFESQSARRKTFFDFDPRGFPRPYPHQG